MQQIKFFPWEAPSTTYWLLNRKCGVHRHLYWLETRGLKQMAWREFQDNEDAGPLALMCTLAVCYCLADIRCRSNMCTSPSSAWNWIGTWSSQRLSGGSVCHESEAASSGSVKSILGFVTNMGKKFAYTIDDRVVWPKVNIYFQFLWYTLWVYLTRTILQCFVTPFRRNQERDTWFSIQE